MPYNAHLTNPFGSIEYLRAYLQKGIILPQESTLLHDEC